MSASCESCGRDIETGYLCKTDTLTLAERLERLPRLYEAVGAFLAPSPQAAGERVSSGHAAAALPVNEAALDLRYGGIVLVLESWRADIQRSLGWGEPPVTGTLEYRVMAAARWLSMNLPMIAAEYPAAGELAREVREIEGAALSIIGAAPDRGRRIGHCVAVDASGIVCGAVLRHKTGETRLVCPWCTCTYEARDFLMLKALQDASHNAREAQAS